MQLNLLKSILKKIIHLYDYVLWALLVNLFIKLYQETIKEKLTLEEIYLSQ